MTYHYQPLGTVIASVLDFTQFFAAINESTVINLERSSYVPCDGRVIIGSRLANLFPDQSMNQAPDLRGKFVRGLNNFDPDYPALDISLLGDPDGAGRAVKSYQADEVKHHSHNARVLPPDNLCFSNKSFDVDEGGDKANNDFRWPAPLPVIVDENPGKESRPRNIALFYYIKIN